MKTSRRELLAAFFVAPIAAALPNPDVFTLEQINECVRKAKNLGGYWVPIEDGLRMWASSQRPGEPLMIGIWDDVILVENHRSD